VIYMKPKKKQMKNQNRRTAPSNSLVAHKKQPFIEHAHELRRRLFYIAISVIAVSSAIYFIQQKVVAALLKPSHGQHFIYTSPGGGIDFLFRVCIYAGLIFSTPVIMYNLLGFLEPLITSGSKKFIISISLISTVLAVAGVVFGYFIGLPAALHFLLHQFKSVQIQPLVTIQSYLHFVMAYILGSSLLFQLPIILICINRIKPLNPKRLFHYERWVILAAFVLSGLMNPTPNLVSQLIVAGPFIIMYQIGIGIIAIVNRPRLPKAVRQMLAQDAATQAQRMELAKSAQFIEPTVLVDEYALAKTQEPKVVKQNKLSDRQRYMSNESIRNNFNVAKRPPTRRTFSDFMPRANNQFENKSGAI
jgi:sec-independent protein translocase protein TatC